MIIARVLSDNGSCYKSRLWTEVCAELGVTVKKTRPYRPQTNGKVCEDWVLARHRPRSDSGQGMTMVSCVRCVDR